MAQHGDRRSSADQKAGKAAHSPGPFEQLLGNIEDRGRVPYADIEHDQRRWSEFSRNTFEQAVYLRPDGRITAIAANAIAMRLALTPLALDRGDAHASFGKTRDERVSKPATRTNNDSNLIRAHGRTPPFCC